MLSANPQLMNTLHGEALFLFLHAAFVALSLAVAQDRDSARPIDVFNSGRPHVDYGFGLYRFGILLASHLKEGSLK